MGHPAVKITDLAFHYPAQSGLLFSHLGLEIADGQRFGLFGPNGAGKTSLMNLMTGILPYEQGSIELLGYPVKKKSRTVNSLFGFVPQDHSFYEELSPVENLEFFGAWSGLSDRDTKKRTEELLSVMGLWDVRDRPVGQFSGGMKRKLNLAIGVIHQPRILFLDEPTVGVDVRTRHELIRYLIELNKKGTTLIYTSHQLDEAEELCDRIALIDQGKIIACDDLSVLLAEHGQSGLEGLFFHLTGNTYEE